MSKDMFESDEEETDQQSETRRVLDAIDQMLKTGTYDSTHLPDDPTARARLEDILSRMESIQNFTFSLSAGNLDSRLDERGFSAGFLKSLQSNLRHLTWQAQQIAQGDYSQRVDFMGEFSDAFNHMVRALNTARLETKQREDELSALNDRLMAEVAVRRQVEETLRESETNFRTFFESATDLIMVGTPDGRFLYANTAVFQNLGYTWDEISGMYLVDVHKGDDQKESADILAAMSREEWDHRSLPLQTKSGELIPVETRVWPGRWNGADCIYSISKDLTAEIEAQQRFEHLFRSNPALMTLTSLPESIFVDVNDVFLTTLGYARSDVIGKTPGDLDLFVNPDQFRSVAEELERTGHISNLELQIRCEDGIIKDGLVSGEIIKIQTRQFFLMVIVDITVRKQTEEQIRVMNQRLTLAADAAQFGIWDLDLVTHHLEWDDWMFRLHGIIRENFGGTYEAWQKGVYPEDLERVNEEIELAVRRKKPFDTEFRIVRPDGEVRYLKANAVVIIDSDNDPVRMTGINYDITDRKESESEITQYVELLGSQNLSLEELSDELMYLNEELDEKVRERTEEISRLLVMKSELITQIGHDLKTPLTSLIALLPYINKKVHEPDLRELLDVVILDAKRMNQIISHILNLDSITIQSPDHLVGTSLVADIVNRAIVAEYLPIGQNDLRVMNQISPSFVISMNEAHADLIFSQLIGNAVKFSRVQGTITISTELSGDTICLIIQDDGVGISSEHLPRLFDEFFKVDPSRHDRDSSGLGLALVQRIVRSYGGTIRAESEGIDKGTIIRICFPVRMVIQFPA
ncbi:MAG TPA: PAS domain S-box protein [Methanospirillum sp.]|nr:PAS domain S-box protein [Methanospirillum sp.]